MVYAKFHEVYQLHWKVLLNMDGSFISSSGRLYFSFVTTDTLVGGEWGLHYK